MNIKAKMKLLPDSILSIIDKASGLADEMNFPAYVVGGFVRDILLAKPRHNALADRLNFDVDIAVEGDGIAFAEKLAGILGAHLLTHKRFGTAVLSLPNKLKIDIATARKETYAYPGALPEVSCGRIYDDLFRRDFSINAMAAVINKHNFGKVIDYFSGISDLKEKRIRILHDLSFIDDPTRMLRAIRFAQRYRFRFEEKTLRLFKQAKEKDLLNMITKHRIRDEIILLLNEPQPVKVIKRIDKLYGFSFMHQKIKLDKAKINFLVQLDRNINHFKKQHAKKRILDDWLIYLAALLSDLEAVQIKNICFEFAFKKGDAKRIISYFAQGAEILKRLGEKNIRPSSVYHLLEPLSFEVIILIMAKLANPGIIKKINEYLLVHNGLRLSIDGTDLRKLGFKPGPYFKEMLVKTMHAKIDQLIHDKEDEIRFIKEHGLRHIKL